MSGKTKKSIADDQRTLAEWTVLAISVAIVLGLVATLVLLHQHAGSAPPSIEVEASASEAREADGQWYVPVTVHNAGDQTADTVRVEVALQGPADEHPETAELEFTFLAGGQSEHGAAAFDEKPTDETLSTSVISYTLP